MEKMRKKGNDGFPFILLHGKSSCCLYFKNEEGVSHAVSSTMTTTNLECSNLNGHHVDLTGPLNNHHQSDSSREIKTSDSTITTGTWAMPCTTCPVIMHLREDVSSSPLCSLTAALLVSGPMAKSVSVQQWNHIIFVHL